MKRFLISVTALPIIFACAISSAGGIDLRVLREDWTAQELRLKHVPGDNESIRAAIDRAEKLIASRKDADFVPEKRSLETFKERFERFDSLTAEERTKLYENIRLLVRDIAFSHPGMKDKPILFMKQRRFVCQMLHEFVGYYYDFGGVSGGGLFVLEEPGKSLKTRCLSETGLPRGAYASPSVSFDGKTVYFAFCEVREQPRKDGTFNNWHRLPDAKDTPDPFKWNSKERNGFHIHSVAADGTNIKRLSDGVFDDFDPCPLPNGRIAFVSSRRGGYCRCNNAFEPLPTYTLHSMDAGGNDIQTLSRHETNEWGASLLRDGRIVYTRWDYVDRSAAHFHGLWASNPDGTSPVVLFGNYTMNLSAAYQPKAIPGSNKIAFIAGAHHALIGGSLVLFDPVKAKYDPKTGEDSFDSLERLSPEVCFPETREGWPDSYFSCPEPLSEDHFLIAFSFHPLPAFGTNYLDDSKSGLYYYDRFGNLELLYRDPEISSVAPQLLAPREIPRNIPSVLYPDLAKTKEGEFLLTDVNWSHFPLPKDRPIKTLRIFQVLPKGGSHTANTPRIGHANAESARAYLGEVPVEKDGSAFFRAPAEVPIYFQAVDAEGRAVQGMRSITYLQAGERRSCVGCHEPISATPDRNIGVKTAMSREPSRIVPGPDGSLPMSFTRLIQPILDKHCVSCHAEGTDRAVEPFLDGEPERGFSHSYHSLEKYVRFYEWGDRSISQITTKPGECGADMSPLTAILVDSNHKDVVALSDEERKRVYLWLDANVPFYGTFDPEMQAKQRAGERVPLPDLQ